MRQMCVSEPSAHVAPGGPGAGKSHFSRDTACSSVQEPVELSPACLAQTLSSQDRSTCAPCWSPNSVLSPSHSTWLSWKGF